MNEITAINLKEYQRPELFDHIADLVDIPGAVMSTIKWAAVGALAGAAAVGLVFSEAHAAWTTVMTGYGLVTGLLWGAFLGFVLVSKKSLERMTGVVDLTLEISELAAHDIGAVRSGDKAMPGAREITWLIYNGVIFPILMSLTGKNVGLIGRPIVWMFSKLMTKLLGATLAVDTSAAEIASELTKLDDDALAGLEDDTAREIAKLQAIRQKIGTIGVHLRRGIIRPLYALLIATVVGLISPALILWWII